VATDGQGRELAELFPGEPGGEELQLLQIPFDNFSGAIETVVIRRSATINSQANISPIETVVLARLTVMGAFYLLNLSAYNERFKCH
jgi:hypothetical protein